MSEGLRWKLVVGCLLLAVLEAPESALVVVQDLRGPWRVEAPVTARAPVSAVALGETSAVLQVGSPDASVGPKERLGFDRNHPFPLARRDVAVLLAR